MVATKTLSGDSQRSPIDGEELRRVLDDNGNVLPGVTVPKVAPETLKKIFDTMLMVRVLDDRMMRIQRQGKLGFYMKSLGEEATHFAVAALRPSDWVFPSYREPVSYTHLTLPTSDLV